MKPFISNRQRVVNGVTKESCLDHVYLNCSKSIISLNKIEPNFGDHLLIFAELNVGIVKTTNIILKRSWKKYDDVTLNCKLRESLANVNINWHDLSVQEHWNELENISIQVTDCIAPLISVDKNANLKSKEIPPYVKRMINEKKRLIKLDKY